jgi:hypothetical protein
MRLLVALLLIQSSAFAADDAERPRLDWRPSPAPSAQVHANPTAMLSAGTLMAVAGLSSLLTGFNYLAKNIFACGIYNDPCSPAEQASIDRNNNVGAPTVVLGAATLAAAVPLMIVGAARVSEQNDAKKKKTLVVPYVAPVAGGGMTGVTIRF